MWKRGAGPRSTAAHPGVLVAARLASHAERITPAPQRQPLSRPPFGSAKDPAPAGAVRYYPHVCSIMGDAIDRIAAAIDQVASDARGVADEPELTARVAEIWLMMGALDPELSRRQQGYTAPGDGTPL